MSEKVREMQELKESESEEERERERKRERMIKGEKGRERMKAR